MKFSFLLLALVALPAVIGCGDGSTTTSAAPADVENMAADKNGKKVEGGAEASVLSAD